MTPNDRHSREDRGSRSCAAPAARSIYGCRQSPSACWPEPLPEREIAVVKDSLDDTPASDAFLTLDRTAQRRARAGRRASTQTYDEHVYAITAAGFQLQVDNAWLGALHRAGTMTSSVTVPGPAASGEGASGWPPHTTPQR